MAWADEREFHRLEAERAVAASEVRWAGLVAMAASSPTVPVPPPSVPTAEQLEEMTRALRVRTHLKYNCEKREWEEQEIW